MPDIEAKPITLAPCLCGRSVRVFRFYDQPTEAGAHINLECEGHASDDCPLDMTLTRDVTSQDDVDAFLAAWNRRTLAPPSGEGAVEPIFKGAGLTYAQAVDHRNHPLRPIIEAAVRNSPAVEGVNATWLRAVASDVATDVLHALAAAPPSGVGEWQPIETARKDGTEMLLMSDGVAHHGCWQGASDGAIYSGSTGRLNWFSRTCEHSLHDEDVTHWSALPSSVPPCQAQPSDEGEWRQFRAISDIWAERVRQIELEGYNAEHDDGYQDRELSRAAAAYALAVPNNRYRPDCWPWSATWWKPRDQRPNLIRAGALIVAEIQRLDRLAALSSGSASE